MKLLIILSLRTAAVEADSCSCLPFNTLEQKYCFSDFGYFKHDPNPKEGPRYFQVTYDVEHTMFTKMRHTSKNYQKKITTAGHESTCGVSFTEGGEYLVGADVGNGYIYASSCGLSWPWAYVSSQDKAALSKYNCSTV